jgi:lipopolysaccharide transport system permease protein
MSSAAEPSKSGAADRSFTYANRTVGMAGHHQETVIEASSKPGWFDLREVWEHRDLWWMFVKRDISVSYKQTVVGVAWAVIKPFITIGIFTLVFGLMARLPSNGFAYPLFFFPAVVIWQYFNKSVTAASQSLVNKKGIISQIYFPRILVPLTDISVGLVDLAVAFVVFAAVLLYYGIYPSWPVVFLPLFLAMAIATALGVGGLLAAIDVRRRDIRQILPNILMFWMYATPIIYPLSFVPEALRPFYGLNPMAGVVEGFRWALLGGYPAPPPEIYIVSGIVTITVLLLGLRKFRIVQRTMTDYA